MRANKRWRKVLVLTVVLVFCFTTQVFSFELSELSDGTLKLGDDFFDSESNALLDTGAVIPIASLLKEGGNKNKAYYKSDGDWYEVFKLYADEFRNPQYALGESEVAALSVGADRWFKAGNEIEYIAPRAASVKPIPDILISVGAEPSLPANVDVVFTDGHTENVPVEWDIDTPEFYNTVGIYYFSGIFDITIQKTADFVGPTVKVRVYDNSVINNIDPNPKTSLNTSPGTTMYEFDSLDELQPSVSAAYVLDKNNVASGSASIRLFPSVPTILPIPSDPDLPQMEFYSVVTTGPLGMGLKELKVMEFNIYKPVIKDRVYDYMLMNFYTDDSHNVFFQTAVGNWELSPGWNKIRRTKDDFVLIDSLAKDTSANLTAMEGTRELTDQWAILSEQVNQLNSFLKAQREKESMFVKSRTLQSTGAPSWGNITCMEFFAVSEVEKSLDINLDKISLNPEGKAIVLFTFDDAWSSVLEYAYPELREKGFKATVWANKEASTDDYPSDDPREVFLNEDELGTIYAAGWDIGNHTVHHYDDINKLKEQQMREEYLENQQWILDNLWERGAYHVCYPSGQYNERLIEILQEIGAKSGRTTEYGIQPTPVSNIYKIKTVFISKNYPENDDHLNNHVIPEIHRTVKTGSSLFFMLHRVEDDPEDDEIGRLAVSIGDFQKVVEIVDGYVKKEELQVMTISEWYDAYMGK